MINITNINITSFSMAEAQSIITPLVIFIVGVVVYSVFIFKFYRFIARKDIFRLDLQQYSETVFGFIGRLLNVIFYIIEFLLIFPFFIFAWFGVISIILIVLSDMQNINQILLISMTLVASIRVTAYYNEDLSRDLAKMFPFALLAIYLLDVTILSYSDITAQLKILLSLWKPMLYYLAFTILLELLLRIVLGIKRLFIPEKNIYGD